MNFDEMTNQTLRMMQGSTGDVIVHGYDRARICINGHLVESAIQRHRKGPQPYCEDCGARTIEECQSPSCAAFIHGDFLDGNAPSRFLHEAPTYCYNCGSAYPWTEATLASAAALVDKLAKLSTKEKQELCAAFPDLLSATPRTTLAAVAFQTLVNKGGADLLKALSAQLADKVVGDALQFIPLLQHH